MYAITDRARLDLTRLLAIARSDNGGGRRVAAFMLSLWDGAQHGCDLQSLLYLNLPVFRDILAVLVAPRKQAARQPDRSGRH